MTKKMLLVGVTLALIVGTIVYKNNIMAYNWWAPLNPAKNPTGYIEGFQTITSGGNIGGGQQAVIRCTIKNQNINYLDIRAYTVEYQPTSIGPLSEEPSKWTGEVIPQGQQDVKSILSSSCFIMPIHMSVGGRTHDGIKIPVIDRIYGKEIDRCINKQVTITLQGGVPGISNAEQGVYIELGSASNKLLDYEEYFYDIDGKLKWHKKNGELQ